MCPQLNIDDVRQVVAGRLVLSQAINDLRIIPKPRAVEVRFSTSFPTIPILEVFAATGAAGSSNDLRPERLRGTMFPLFGGMRRRHHVEFKDLDPATLFWLRITVTTDSAPIRTPDGLLRLVTTFSTASRTCTMTIQRIRILKDGDPGGSAEMAFSMSIYDAEAGHQLIEPRFHPQGGGHISISDEPGNNIVRRPFGAAIRIENAPDTIAPWILAKEDDSSIFLFQTGLVGMRPPDRLPQSQTNVNAAGYELTSVAMTLRLRDAPGVENRPFTMFTGFTHLIYDVNGSIETVVREGPRVYYGTSPDIIAKSRQLAYAARGLQGIAALPDEGGGMLLAIDHEGRLLGARGDQREPQWQFVTAGVRQLMGRVDSIVGAYEILLVGNDSVRVGRMGRGEALDGSRITWQEVGGLDAAPAEITVWAHAGLSGFVALDREGTLSRLEHAAWVRVGNVMPGRIAGALVHQEQLHVLVQQGERAVYTVLGPTGDTKESHNLDVSREQALLGIGLLESGRPFVLAMGSDAVVHGLQIGGEDGWQRVSTWLELVMEAEESASGHEDLVRVAMPSTEPGDAARAATRQDGAQ